MEEINILLEKFKKTAENPKQAAENIIKNGKKICGIMPAYVPEEIAYAAGYIPMGIWGGEREVKNAGAFLPPFSCSIMLSVMEGVLKGVYEKCDFIMVSSLCDTLKCMGQKMRSFNKIIQIAPPHNGNIYGAEEYLLEEYTKAKEKTEEISGKKISEKDLKNAIDIYNENYEALRNFSKIASEHLDIITPTVRHSIFKAGFFSDRKKHTADVKKLCSLLEKREKYTGGKRIMLTGIIADDDRILKRFEEYGFVVAEDELLNESRFAEQKIPENAELLRALVLKWLKTENCSLAYDPKKSRIENIAQKAKNCHAVIHCFMPFCDVEAFDEPFLTERLKEEGIPHIKLDFGRQDINLARAETKLEALSEMLEE